MANMTMLAPTMEPPLAFGSLTVKLGNLPYGTGHNPHRTSRAAVTGDPEHLIDGIVLEKPLSRRLVRIASN